MTNIIESIRAEYLRYKALAEGALDQISEAELSAQGPGGGNSIAVICRHISGNLGSRFTDFLTSDGEKPWRAREEEFQARTVTRAALLYRMGAGVGGAPGHAGESHGRTAPPRGDHSRSVHAGARGAASCPRAPQLPRGPGRLCGESPARRELDVSEHSAGHVRRVQSGADTRTTGVAPGGALREGWEGGRWRQLPGGDGRRRGAGCSASCC